MSGNNNIYHNSISAHKNMRAYNDDAGVEF